MNQSLDQIQTLQVLYELSMSIGTSLDLRAMLKVSLLAFLKKLDCVAGGVYQYQDGGEAFHLEAVHSIPRRTARNAAYQAALAQLPTAPDAEQMAQLLAALPLVDQSEDKNYYHLFELPNFGVLILVKNKRAIRPELLKSLRPLLEKLASAAIACLSEEALRQAQERSQIILESVTTPLLISRVADGKIIYANQLLADMIRSPLDDLIGNVTPDFYADKSDRETLLLALREKGALNNYELHLKRTDGDLIWVLISIRLFKFQGEAALITTFLDITERKQTARILEESQARTQLILESVTLPLLISRVEDGRALYANKRLAELMNMLPEEILGQQTPDFYRNPADRQEILDGLRSQGGVDNKELPIVRADGAPLWVLLSNRLVEYDGETAIITTLVDITARKQAEEALAKRAAELETVAQVSAAASTILETDRLLQKVVDLTKDRFDLYHAHIYLLNRSGDTLILTAGAGDVGRQMVAEKRAISLAQEQSLVAQAARTKRGVIENDVRHNPAFLPNPLLPDTQAEMAVPMLVGDRVVGVLDVQANEINHFTQQDVTVNTTLAAQIGVALENARSFEDAQTSLAETEALLDITRETSRTLELNTILENVLDKVLATTKFDVGLISMENPETQTLELISHRLPDAFLAVVERHGFEGSLCDLVYRRKRAIVVTDLAKDAPVNVSRLIDMGYQSYQGVPMEAKGSVFGTICLFCADRLSSEEANTVFLRAVGQQVGIAIRNATLFEENKLALSQARRSEEALAKQAEDLNELTRRLTKEGWQDYLEQTALGNIGYIYDGSQANSLLPVSSAANNDAPEANDGDGLPSSSIIHPISIHGEAIGKVELFTENDEEEMESEVTEIVRSVLEQLGARIENLRLTDQTQLALAETEEQAQRLGRLNEMSAALNQAASLADVYNVTVSETAKVMAVDRVSLMLLNAARDSFEIAAAWGDDDLNLPSGTTIPVADAPMYAAVQENRIIRGVVEGVMASALFVPLAVGEKTIGVLNVGNKVRREHKASDENLLRQAAAMVGSTIENIRFLLNEQARAQKEQFLRQITEKVRGSSDVETIMRVAVKEVGQALGRRTYIKIDPEKEFPIAGTGNGASHE